MELFPEVSPTANIAEEEILAGDLVSAYPNERGPQESAPREYLFAVPQEFSEDDASSEDSEVDVLPVAVKSESPVQHHVHAPVHIAPITVIPLETSEDGAPEEHGAPSSEDIGQMLLIVPNDNAEVEPDTFPEPLLKTSEEKESAVLVPAEAEDEGADQHEFAAEEEVPEETAVMVLEETAEQEPDTGKQRESVQVVSSGTKEATEHVKEENAFAPIVLEENAEQDLVIEEPEEESAVLAPAETQNKEADQDTFAAEETVPEELIVILLEEPAEEQPLTEDQGEKVYIVSTDRKEASEHLKEEGDAVVMEENAVDSVFKEPEEESVVLFPVQFEDDGEHAAEETAPQESGSEEPAAIVPVDSSEGESEQKEQVKEETVSKVSSAADKKGEPPEAEAPVTVVPVDLKTNKEGQEETATQELSLVILVEPTSEEPSLEDVILITPLEDPDKKVSEDYMEEEKVQTDPLPQEPALEEYEPDESDRDILIISVTDTTSDTTVQDPAEKVPVAATEILTEASAEPVTSRAPAVTDAEVEIVPASVEDVSVTDFTTHSDDFKAAGILTENESAGENLDIFRNLYVNAYFTIM